MNMDLCGTLRKFRGTFSNFPSFENNRENRRQHAIKVDLLVALRNKALGEGDGNGIAGTNNLYLPSKTTGEATTLLPS